MTRNCAALGRLQLGGRRVYTAAAPDAAAAPPPLGGRAAAGGGDAASTLQRSGLPAELVERWRTGRLTPALALREILDAVAAAGVSTSNEHRELSSMSQLWASSPEAIGGTLGGLAGGMPATGERADVEPLLLLLGRPPEGVTVDALRLFTRELLGAESDAVADGGGGRVERRALEADLAKLSADELNLAFRRACLQQHPQRADGSLAGLLRVHLAFELVRAVWLRAAAAGGGGGAPAEAAAAARAAADGAVLRELRAGEAALREEAEGMEASELDALNEGMQAKALRLCKLRDLLEAQLEALQAVGSYAVLGVEPSCSDRELQAAYREMARRLHPDRGGDKERFQQLQAAYQQVLLARKAGAGAGGARKAADAGGKGAKRKAPSPTAAAEGEGEGAEAEGEEEAAADGGAEAASETTAAEEEPKEEDAAAEEQAEEEAPAEAQEEGEAEAEAAADGDGDADAAAGGEAAAEFPEFGSAAAAAAAAEAAATMAAEDMLDVDGVGSLSAEEMCRLAEQAAEAARACAASARIAKRVSSLGAQGWEVLCECAQCVLRSARSAAAGVARVGAAAVDAPRTVSETVDGAAGRKLSKRAEREVRALLDGMMVAMRQGRCAMLSSAVCSSKASEAAELVLSLARLPYSGSALGSAVGGAQLGSLMRRVAEVLADIRAAVGEAAEHAMSTAVAVAEMKRKGELVKELSATAEEHEPAADGDGDGGAAKEDGGGEAAAEEEGGASAAVKRRLENARWLAKLSVELCASQEELKRLVGGAPQLIPAVSVAAKEEVFDLLGECLAAAEALDRPPLVREPRRRAGGWRRLGAARGMGVSRRV